MPASSINHTAPLVLEAREATPKRPKWTVNLYAEGLRGDRDDGASFHLLRKDAPRAAQMIDALASRRTLVIKKPKRRALQFDAQSYQTLRSWFSSSLLLRMALRQRLAWTIPIGVLFLITSLPMPGDAEADLAPLPFNPINAALGAFLVLQGVLSRYWPHRIYLLLDAAWFLALAASVVSSVAYGAHPLWLILAPLQLLLAVSNMIQWRHLGQQIIPIMVAVGSLEDSTATGSGKDATPVSP